MGDTSQPAFYPRYCFHLAPTANAWCFFRTAELFTLEQKSGFEGECLYFYRNLPIKWVRIVGVVVAIDEFSGLRVYTVDDSSGACIEAVISLTTTTTAPSTQTDDAAVAAPIGPLAQPVTPYDHIDVGSVVDVKGALSTFRDARQIKVERMTCLRGTSEEIKLWAKRTAFRRDVLETPWVLPDRTLRKCRKEAERTEAEVGRERGRAKTASAANEPGKTAARKATRQERSSNHEDARRKRSAPKKDDVIQILAESKGKYSALGL